MAICWMDSFTIYGTDAGRVARLLNGVYAEASSVDLAVDPDPTAGGGRVLVFNGGVIRKVLPTARTTVGVAARYWPIQIPPNGTVIPIFWSLRDVNNVVHCYMKIDASGNLVVVRADAGGDVIIGQSANPVVVANAWQHIESKVFLDAAAGTVEVRVEGVTVINVAGIRTITNVGGEVPSCSSIAMSKGGSVGSSNFYVKDFILWDNTTAFNNTFMGSCQVLRIAPDADVSLNWTPSSGATGFNLINELTPDDDVNYISAPTPFPAAYKCSLTDVPVTVTSVRGVMPIHRSRKVDGGDGNIQVGLISGASTGLGVDRPITTAYTYWWDIYDADPNGGIAWSRTSLNAVNLQLNRTL